MEIVFAEVRWSFLAWSDKALLQGHQWQNAVPAESQKELYTPDRSDSVYNYQLIF